MEDKIYFTPEEYGRKTETRCKGKKRDHHLIVKLLGILLLICIIVIIIWLLRGKTTISGRFPENVNDELLTCSATDLIPPKIDSIDSNKKEIKVNAIFNNDDELKTISLIYTLYYSNDEEAYGAEAQAHAEFNKALYASGYDIDKFLNKFARYDNKLIITLSASENDIDEISAPFLMINHNNNIEIITDNLSALQKNYETQGFICKNTKI